MARQKLNKKVAIIGSLILALFLAGAVVVFLRLTQDPEQFVKEGDVAREAKDYESAERNYRKAFGLAKKTLLQVEIAFKLADLYIEMGDWMKAAGTWSRIITLDTKNIRARQNLLDFTYESAVNGQWTHWRMVESNCSDLIDLEPNPQLFFRRGRARLEMAARGQTTDREKSIAEAIEDLEKTLQLEPNDSEPYRYLAKAILTKGNILSSKGSFGEAEKMLEEAQQVLQRAIDLLPEEPQLYTDLVSIKLIAAEEPEERKALEPEYLAIVDKFHSSPEVFTALSQYYLADHTKVNEAIEAIEQARELAPENVDNILSAAELYYRRAQLNKQQADINKAIEIAERALDLPDVQNVSGPRQFRNKTNKLRLYLFLAHCWIEQALEAYSPNKQAEKEQFLARASQALHEIQQIYGSRENPQVLMWEGRLMLAKGQMSDAIRQMYAAYEQLKAEPASREQRIYFAHLCYTLAGVFKSTTETGACGEFLRTAIDQGLARFKPDVLLDYAAVVLSLGMEHQAMRIIDFYEKNFTANQRSGLLYTRACNKAGLFDQSEERLAQMDPTEPNAIALRLSMIQSKLYRHVAALKTKSVQEFVPLEELVDAEDLTEFKLSEAQVEKLAEEGIGQIEKLLQIEPDFVTVPMLTAVCNYYVSKDQIGHSKDLVEKFLDHFPNNTSALVYKAQLYEPEPNNITLERRKEIIKQVLSTTGDEISRCLNLADFYKDSNRPDEAVTQYKKALEIDPCNPKAVLGLFDIGMAGYDFVAVEQLIQATRHLNIDGCNGQYFAGRLALARDQFQDALAKFDIALKERPVFSQGYLYRSIVHSLLGNDEGAVADARRAAEMNPKDGDIARRFAGILYQRNQRLGADISPEQFEETRSALLRAAALNPGDARLTGLYAEYISEKEPLEALAYRQRIQQVAPSVQNAVRLANLATDIAMDERDAKQKQALFDIASSAFERARSMDPDNKDVLRNYARFYRRIGKPEKAEQLLAEVQDKGLMWRNYISTGQLDKAKEILQQMYQAEPNNTDAIRGLFILAERTGDREGVMRYSNELLAIDPSPENQLYQIQAMLQLGILVEVEKKLESFNEKYPANELAMQMQAFLALRKGKFSKALELTNKVLETHPGNEKAWYLRGRLYHLMGNYTQAIRDLQKSKTISDNPDVRIQLAKTYLRVGRADNAITELNTALDDENAPANTRRILEQVYFSLGRMQDLIKLYDDAIKKYPDGIYWYNQAASLMARMQKYENAERLFLMAWQKSQNLDLGGDLTSFDGYLVALKSAKKYDRLLRYARRYIDGQTAPIAFGRMAEVKAEMGDKVTATQYFQKAIEKAGTNSALVLTILDLMYSTLGRYETEAWCLNKLQSEPDSFVANFAMFTLTKLSGEYNKAIGYIEKCVQTLQDDDPKKETFVTYKVNCLQSAYARTSDNQYITTAIDEYKKLLEKVPNNIAALNNMAYMLADNDKELDKALVYAQQAYNLAPDKADIMDTYAYVLYRNGKYQQAAEVQRSAVQIFEQGQATAPPEIYHHLGMIVEKLGGRTEALAAYKQAMETGEGRLSPKDKKLVEEAIERLSNLAGE